MIPGKTATKPMQGKDFIKYCFPTVYGKTSKSDTIAENIFKEMK